MPTAATSLPLARGILVGRGRAMTPHASAGSANAPATAGSALIIDQTATMAASGSASVCSAGPDARPFLSWLAHPRYASAAGPTHQLASPMACCAA